MDCDVNTTTQISKIIAPNSGEPFVVETKTTTTTTTTTTVKKRICVGKDANVDLTEIQALLDNDDVDELVDEVPPKVNVTNTITSTGEKNKSKQHNETTVDKSKKRDKSKIRNKKRKTTSNHRLSDENRSPFLSSTKIEDSLKSSSQNKHQDSFKDQQKTTTKIVCSPNLSKISANSSKTNSNKSSSSSSKNNINNIKNNSKADNKQKSLTNKTATKQFKKKRIKPASRKTNTNTSGNCEKMGDVPQRKSTRTLRSRAVEKQGPNYIDDLISKYIALDKAPSTQRKKRVAPPVEKPSTATPSQPVALPQPPPIDLPDLSAIFENSTEDEGATAATTVIEANAIANANTDDRAGSSSSFQVPGNVSPASFTDYDLGPDDYQMPISSSTVIDEAPELTVADIDDVDDVAMPLKEHTKNNRAKRKLLPDTADEKAAKPINDVSKRSKKIVKKEPTTAKKATTKSTPTTTTTAKKKKPTQSVECDSTTNSTTAAPASAINESVRSNICYSPIKLYSPSNRARLRTIANNKLVLTKRSMAKKLQNLPTPSKNSILDRFDASHPMTVDADSRLILYPNLNSDDDDNGAGDIDVSKRGNGIEHPVESNKNGMDLLSRLKHMHRPLLVKEIDKTDCEGKKIHNTQ